MESDAPPAYAEAAQPGHEVYQNPFISRDPRHSSTQSLIASDPESDGRRTLLLIYVHGFLGNETSFQSFPAHVHNLLSITLAETHTIHSKIYPRYKSRDDITLARDKFSIWLEPHESPNTDVILLGHSMGGLVSAEVVLMPSNRQGDTQKLRHRILGSINFDVPFLGMHPGVIRSGLESLVRPADKSPAPKNVGASPSNEALAQTTSSSGSLGVASSNELPPLASSLSPHSTLADPPIDPNFNPSFTNDVRIPLRKGWEGAIHFVTKHYSDGLAKASANYLTSHFEFGGCMADYPGLKRRYEKLRALEDIGLHKPSQNSRADTRVRFVNYYTASSGRPKKPKSSSPTGKRTSLAPPPAQSRISSPSTSPRISISEHRDSGEIVQIDIPEDADFVESAVEETEALSIVDPISEDVAITQSSTVIPELQDLAPIPSVPEEPAFVDLSKFSDKDTRKIAEKEYSRALKAYKQAVKDRNKAIKDRQKLIEKRKKKAERERAKEDSDPTNELSQVEKAERDQVRIAEDQALARASTTTTNQPSPGTAAPLSESVSAPASTTPEKEGKKKRDRKFCVTPSKVNGEMDKTWVRIYLEGVDEVGAHCGLFFMGETYERLVGDVAVRIEDWVKEDSSERAAKGLDSDAGEKSGL